MKLVVMLKLCTCSRLAMGLLVGLALRHSHVSALQRTHPLLSTVPSPPPSIASRNEVVAAARNGNSKQYEPYPGPSAISAESTLWALQQKIDDPHAAPTHSLFRDVASHLRSHTSSDGSRATCSPFLVPRNAESDSPPIVEFTCHDLEHALACDYLDACTGAAGRNDNGSRDGNDEKPQEEPGGGWRLKQLSSENRRPGTGTEGVNIRSPQSFQSKRIRWSSVEDAPDTVVFNSAGAHISHKLALVSLAALHGLDGAAAGVCLNLYVTKADVRKSAPPHTDKQDVVVLQTQGRKRWRIYSPPDTALRANADPFCRGKGDDELTAAILEREGSELLMDVTLFPGDVLFVPARFPHTTDTLDCYEGGAGRRFGKEDWSMHLTVGLDSHVWAMNYMSMRTLGLRRFGNHDVLRRADRDAERCVGKINRLGLGLREGLFSSVDDSLLFVRSEQPHRPIMDQNIAGVASNLLSFHERTNAESGWRSDAKNTFTYDQCVETVRHCQSIWQKILSTHEDMYISALEEEKSRQSEGAGWAINVEDSMSKERADRLSIFRVPVYFEQFDKLREELRIWGDQGGDLSPHGIDSNALWSGASAPTILSGDQVEAKLGTDGNTVGASVENMDSWSSATVIEVGSDGLFNLQLFDGTVREGVERNNIKGPHGIGVFL